MDDPSLNLQGAAGFSPAANGVASARSAPCNVEFAAVPGSEIRSFLSAFVARAVSESPQAQRAARGRELYYPDVVDAQWYDWKWQFKNRITTIEELGRQISIPQDELQIRREILRDFRMGITPYYLSLVDRDRPDDPVLRQVAPDRDEHTHRADGEEDPLDEEKFSPVPGITHRYPDRCLMVVGNACAIYCRFCTRKRIMYEDALPEMEVLAMLDYIARTPAIRDVVVSGGDPLAFTTAKLERILSGLRAIPHVEIIRIGSRVPVSIPMRVTDELCDMLSKYHPLWINVHFNHPNEITPDAARACDKLLRAGIPLNNQSVLLRGVNDSVPVMRDLVHGLLKMRVRPYYLYVCDPVRGATHFRTSVAKGVEIIEGLRGHTSGLAIPQFVVDAPGGGGKIPVNPEYLLSHADGTTVLRNFQGRIFEYRDPVDLSAAPRGSESDSGPAPPSSGEVDPSVVGKSSWVHRSGGGRSLNGNGKSR